MKYLLSLNKNNIMTKYLLSYFQTNNSFNSCNFVRSILNHFIPESIKIDPSYVIGAYL